MWSSSRLRCFRERRPSSILERSSAARSHVAAFSTSSARERLARKRSVSSAFLEMSRRLGDLAVRAAFQLTEDERLALVFGKSLERSDQLVDRRAAAVRRLPGGDVVIELHLDGTSLLLSEALADDVVGDRDQPVRRPARPLPAFEGAQGVDERRLGDVLGVGMVAEDGVRVAVDLARVCRYRSSRARDAATMDSAVDIDSHRERITSPWHPPLRCSYRREREDECRPSPEPPLAGDEPGGNRAPRVGDALAGQAPWLFQRTLYV